jgi:hypothetical protein
MIYVEQPYGFQQLEDSITMVCLLLKGMYGLKQSAFL